MGCFIAIIMCVLDSQKCAYWQKMLQGSLGGVTVYTYIATSDSRLTAARARCTSYSCMHEASIQHILTVHNVSIIVNNTG